MASASLPRGQNHLFLKVDRRLISVELTAIECIEAFGEYLKVYTADQVFVTYMALGMCRHFVSQIKKLLLYFQCSIEVLKFTNYPKILNK